MAVLALQQLTGSNFFFYHETTVFTSVGTSNSHATQIALGVVNIVCTFPGSWFAENAGFGIA
jgi:MFS transporter, SP family, sugar:H+ symporter